MYWNRPNLPNRPILSISNLSPRNYDAGLSFHFTEFLVKWKLYQRVFKNLAVIFSKIKAFVNIPIES